MSFLPLILGVRRLSGAETGSSQGRSPAKPEAEKTLQRDDFTCRFCGFRAERYQRVINAPSHVANNQDLLTACTFCEQCVTLERAGMMGSGVLIWLPEIQQAELNHLVRAIYIARETETDMVKTADRAFDVLLARRTDAKKRIGSDDPIVLATAMFESLDDKAYKNALGKLEGLRLLPLDKYVVRTRSGDVNQFSQMVKYWLSAKGPYARLPVDQWLSLFEAAQSKVGHA